MTDLTNKKGENFFSTVRWRNEYVIVFLLILMTWGAYWDLSQHGFLAIDDNAYVTDNPYVQMGLTPHSVTWALTTLNAEFWHPLTWLSLMLDTSLYGVSPAGYLTTNLFLHIFNTLILFFILLKMTQKIWRAFFVTALFAVHPLHVESVAWISERKDLLSTFFSLLTMLCYYYYIQKQNWVRYGLVLSLFLLALMSKSTPVTLPFLLIILDYWPLHRIHLPFKTQYIEKDSEVKQLSIKGSVIEKIPLIAISFFFSWLTLLAQGKGGGVVPLSDLSFLNRLETSVIAYISYIVKMIVPIHLGVFYPIREVTPFYYVAPYFVLFCMLCALPILYYQSKPYISSGILWYLGTLFPMIGIIKIGNFSMADRFTYFPLIGLFILLVWGIADLALTFKRIDSIIKVSATLTLLILTMMTYQQTRHWTNSISLYSHTILVTKDNDFCHYGLAKIYANRKDIENAISHFKACVRIRPDSSKYQTDLGRILAASGNFEEALTHLSAAYELNQTNEEMLYYLGITHHALENDVEALVVINKLLVLLQQRTGIKGHTLEISHLKKIPGCKDVNCFQRIFNLLKIKSGRENLKRAVERGYHKWPYLRDIITR